MKTKTILILTFVAIFVTFSATPPAAWAGSAQRHRWEGVAIGVGAAIIGSTLIKAYHDTHGGPAPNGQVMHHYYHPSPPEPAGHWENRREWVPPQYRKVWNPAHYDRRGRWVAGRWIRTEVQSGYWMEKRVWVPYE